MTRRRRALAPLHASLTLLALACGSGSRATPGAPTVDAGRVTPRDATAPDAVVDATSDAFVPRPGDLGSGSPIIVHGDGGGVAPPLTGIVGATWQPAGCSEQVPVATGITGAAWGSEAYGTTDPSPHAVHASWSADTSSTLAVIWETDADTLATTIAYGDSPTRLDHFAQGVTFINPPQSYDILPYPLRAHEVHVCGLAPGQTYYYAVGGDGYYGSVYSAKTAPAVGSSAPFRMVVEGDSKNIFYTYFAQITGMLPTYAPDWMLFTGDLVHDGPSAREWENWFEAAGPFIANVPTMTVHGNHEAMATAYFALFAMPGQEDVYAFDYGNAHIVVLNDSPNDPAELTGSEAAFLEADLTAAESRPVPPTWLITSHHRPMFDSDPGEGSNLTVRAAWNGILQKHHVDLDMNGHAHHWESTLPIGEDAGIVEAGPRFITAGGAGALLDLATPTPNAWTVTYYAGLSFGIVDVDGRTLTLQGYRVDGSKIESSPIVLTK